MSLVATRKDRLYTVVVVVVVIAAVGFGYFFITKPNGSHTIYARFANAQFLVSGNTVHVDGVVAGKVQSLTVDSKTNTAMVKMSLNKADWPIHTDATATVRPVTILGEQYVDLSGGSPSAPAMKEGGIISGSSTGSSTNLQSVLDAVNDPTATALGVMLTSLGNGVAGQGQNAYNAIRALSPALSDTNGLLKLLDGQNQLLTQMLDNVTPVLHSLDTGQGQSLNNLLTTTNSLLTATADSSNNVGTDLQNLPATLQSATSAFNQLGNLSDQATPALASLTPLTNNLQSVSQELLNFSAAANPAATSLQPFLTQAKNFIDQATPVVNTLKTESPAGLQDVQALQPIVHQNVADLNNFFKFISEWASTTSNYDGTGHYFRFHFSAECTATTTGTTTICPPAGSPLSDNTPVSSSAAAKSAKSASTVKASTAAAPAAAAPKASSSAPVLPQLPSVLAAPGQAVNNLLGGLLGGLSTPAPAPAAGTSATGLTPSQEQDLVGYLLGGGL